MEVGPGVATAAIFKYTFATELARFAGEDFESVALFLAVELGRIADRGVGLGGIAGQQDLALPVYHGLPAEPGGAVAQSDMKYLVLGRGLGTVMVMAQPPE